LKGGKEKVVAHSDQAVLGVRGGGGGRTESKELYGETWWAFEKRRGEKKERSVTRLLNSAEAEKGGGEWTGEIFVRAQRGWG